MNVSTVTDKPERRGSTTPSMRLIAGLEDGVVPAGYILAMMDREEARTALNGLRRVRMDEAE